MYTYVYVIKFFNFSHYLTILKPEIYKIINDYSIERNSPVYTFFVSFSTAINFQLLFNCLWKRH